MTGQTLTVDGGASLMNPHFPLAASNPGVDYQSIDMALVVKRVYEKPARGDGTRVLVDRLWPRGLTKAAASVDVWLRDLAPSNELRKLYHENRAAWALFRRRYSRELKKPETIQALQQLYELISRDKTVALLFASTNLERNNAVALKEILERAGKPPRNTGVLPGGRISMACRQPATTRKQTGQPRGQPPRMEPTN